MRKRSGKRRNGNSEQANTSTLERLEDRLLLSAVVSGPTLTITGTDGPDNIILSVQRGTAWYVADVNGQRQSFAPNYIRRIRINGGDGDDRIIVRSRMYFQADITIDGGPGDNSIVGLFNSKRPGAAAIQLAQTGDGGSVSPPAEKSAFTLYDGTFFLTDPDLSPWGLSEIGVAVYNDISVTGDSTSGDPSEAKVRALARRSKPGDMLVLDVEHLPIDIRFVSREVAAANLDILGRIVDWCHDEAPWLKVGYYYLFPLANTHVTQSPAYIAAYQEAIDFVRPLIQKIDVLFPQFYTYTTDPEIWLAKARGEIAAMRPWGKPILGYMMYHYADHTPMEGTDVSPDYWRYQLDAMRELADGAVLFGGYQKVFDPGTPIWQATDRFTHEEVRIPSAATNLKVVPGATSAALTWTDVADNEGRYEVQRSSDGVHFQTIKTLLPNSTSWTDPAAAPGDRYYRVLAVNSFGSASTNIVSASVYFDSSSTLQAEAYSATSGAYRAGWYIGVANSNWIRFSNVLFSNQPRILQAALSAPDDKGGALEIRLDSPTGKLAGTLDIKTTGGWANFTLQSTAVTVTPGTHDVYLIFRGSANIDYFRFVS